MTAVRAQRVEACPLCGEVWAVGDVIRLHFPRLREGGPARSQWAHDGCAATANRAQYDA